MAIMFMFNDIISSDQSIINRGEALLRTLGRAIFWGIVKSLLNTKQVAIGAKQDPKIRAFNTTDKHFSAQPHQNITSETCVQARTTYNTSAAMEITKFVVSGRDNAKLHGDYATYRTQLSNRIQTFRKRLSIATKPRAKYAPKAPVTAGDVARNQE